ncbi:Glycosyltransferase AglD [uncultured archaeon]|nr:Glycosyltransferase AglD [uncultured archaeon]
MNYLIIPAYNEEKRIIKNLNTYSKTFSNWKIIVVVNGSTDNTYKLVKKFSETHYNIKPIEAKEKIRKGGAVKLGFNIALKTAKNNDLIGFVDADSSTSPQEFSKLIEMIQKEKIDGIIASRYSHGGKMNPKQSKTRRIASRIMNLIVRILFNLKYTDTQCGAKLFRARALKQIISKMKEKGWMFDVELLYLLKKTNNKIESVGINWKNDTRSHLNVSNAPKMLYDIIKIRLKL